MKRLLPLVLLVALPLALSTPALADSAGSVANALKSSHIYQTAGADLLDTGELRSVLAGEKPEIDVAVLPAGAAPSTDPDTASGQAFQAATEIVRALGRANAVVLIITANKHLGADEGPQAQAQGVRAGRALSEQLSSNKGQPFDKQHITDFVKAFKERISAQVAAFHPSKGSSGSSSSSSTSSGGNGGVTLLIGLLALGGIGFFLYYRSSKKKKASKLEGLRADVEQLYNRLGSEVSLLSPGDHEVARQAMADASERYNTCGATLATADSPAEFAAARRTAVEGLTAARVARKELGLDPGPEIPLPAGSGPQLTEEQQLQMGEQTVYGSPSYAPGRQHYYGGGMVGGRMVQGGWYSMPFWEPFLLGSMLSGGFGGGGLFGGGGGYGAGYEEGREDAQNQGGNSGDWGGGGDSGGGGDWGGGGDSGGAGDWGGGGDSGGGGDW